VGSALVSLLYFYPAFRFPAGLGTARTQSTLAILVVAASAVLIYGSKDVAGQTQNSAGVRLPGTPPRVRNHAQPRITGSWASPRSGHGTG
jgi:hypothetical protein